MSRALGAAFLTHQVEQLEKTVSAGDPRTYNWRDRRPVPNKDRVPNGARANTNPGKRAPLPVGGIKVATRRKAEGERGDAVLRDDTKARLIEDAIKAEKRREERAREREKDADVIVLDASVLVHALGQVKKWCRDGRREILIVPLEALNTLDLLKKGVSHLAQRARAASRVLEAQVGANPRVRVQSDSAFVLWDSIAFKDSTDASQPSPEWVRRTICCAKWEATHVKEELAEVNEPKIVLATLTQAAPAPVAGARNEPVSSSPVPLPAPHPNKYEPRSAGTLVSYWACRADLEIIEVASQPIGESPPGNGRISSEEERDRPKRGLRGRRNSNPHSIGYGSDRDKDRAHHGGHGLVERPPAVKAMMDMVAQPSKVVRVLARGEKLEP
ncbi:hypothetical protein OF83DRAFT_1168399 [Amylostereum chailletii]|nr:hypothetical protein OF83DRAFT_1168399 [Amylostereum chailletii]